MKRMKHYPLVLLLTIPMHLGCSPSDDRKNYSMSFVLDASAVAKIKRGQNLRLEQREDPATDAWTPSFYLSRQHGATISVPLNFDRAVHSTEVIEIRDSNGTVLYNRDKIKILDHRFGGEVRDGILRRYSYFFRP